MLSSLFPGAALLVLPTLVLGLSIDARAPKPNKHRCPASCSDPIGARLTLDFESTSCQTLCPMPLEYNGFIFDGSAGWQALNSSSSFAPDSRVATSGTGTLVTNSSGWVAFGTFSPGWTDPFIFDVLSLRFTVWTNDNVEGHDVEFFARGKKSSDAPDLLYQTTVTSGIPGIAPYTLDFTSSGELDATNLVNIAFRAYSAYDSETDTGTPATIIFDDIIYIRRFDPCKGMNTPH